MSLTRFYVIHLNKPLNTVWLECSWNPNRNCVCGKLWAAAWRSLRTRNNSIKCKTTVKIKVAETILNTNSKV